MSRCLELILHNSIQAVVEKMGKDEMGGYIT